MIASSFSLPATRTEREFVFRRLNEAMNEAVAVEHDGIRVANAKFAELCGATSPAQLVGRPLTELVDPDFAELLAEHLRRHHCGQPVPDRLEVEMRPIAGHTPRIEFSFSRISYEGKPSLLVSAVEMTPAPDAGHLRRGHATAWEALDALGEGVMTTDAEGRIAYVNKAGEGLIGRPAPDALGKTLLEVIDLVEEGQRQSLGDPVRQCLASGGRVNIGRRGMVLSGDSDASKNTGSYGLVTFR